MGIPISWDVSPFSLGYVSCILIPRWSSRESAYPSTSIACRFSMRSLWLGVFTSQESIKKGTELRIYPGSCWCFHHHFQDLPGFQLLWPYLGGFFLHITYRQYEPVNDLPMKEPPKKKNLSNKHGKNRGIDKMKLVSKRGSSTCSLWCQNFWLIGLWSISSLAFGSLRKSKFFRCRARVISKLMVNQPPTSIKPIL